MDVSFGIIWVVALALIAALGVVLAVSLRGEKRPEPARDTDAVGGDEVHDTLLFDYGEMGVRSTTRGNVIVYLPGAAWEADWRQDLIRVDVNQVAVDAADLGNEWSGVEVLSAYDLRAYRIAETSIDEEIQGFGVPIHIFVTHEGADRGLRLLARQEGAWFSAAATTAFTDGMESSHLLPGQVWRGTSTTKLGLLCLVQTSELAEPLSW